MHPDNPGVEIWLARWMIYVAWGRPTGCECDGCRCGHEDEMGAETR